MASYIQPQQDITMGTQEGGGGNIGEWVIFKETGQ